LAVTVGDSIVLKAGAVRNVWKTVTLGEFANSFALRNALDAADCGIGPAFTLASTKTDVDLVVVSAAELGLASMQFASPIL